MTTLAILDSFDTTDYPNVAGAHWHKIDCTCLATECGSNDVRFCKLDAGFADYIGAADQLNVVSPAIAEAGDKTAATIGVVAVVTSEDSIDFWRKS